MRYWDTSAIMPLVSLEPLSGDVRRLLEEDAGVGLVKVRSQTTYKDLKPQRQGDEVPCCHGSQTTYKGKTI